MKHLKNCNKKSNSYQGETESILEFENANKEVITIALLTRK
jgi:hypothetical protein